MPILDAHSVEFISRSAEQTRRLGMRLGAYLRTGDLICLVGDLGSGKTTFVQGIASGWGSLDLVSSPTFVLVNVYRRREGPRSQPYRPELRLGEVARPDSQGVQRRSLRLEERLFHLDAYRLSGAGEAEDLDPDGFMENGPLVIEWAERIEAILPPERLWIRMRWIEENQRDLIFTARGARYEAILASLRRQVFGVH